MKNSFRIDEEFRGLIPDLTDEEKVELRASINADGCRDALVVWKEKQILLDGHNRFEICTELGKDFKVREKSLEDRDAAELWIIDNQDARRNLTPFQRAELQLKRKAIVARQAKARMLAGKKDPGQNSDQGKTLKVLAAAAGVSHDTLAKIEVILENGAKELVEAARRGEISVNAAAEISTLDKSVQRDVAREGNATAIRIAKELKRNKAKARKAMRAKEKADAVKESHPLNGDRFRLICGDIAKAARQIEDESVDAIITDPPYGEEYAGLYAALSRVAAKVLRPGGHCLVMTGQANLLKIIQKLCSVPTVSYQWTLAYLTPGESTQVFGRKVKSNWKPVIWLVKGKCDWEHVEDTVRSDMNDKRFHEWGQSVGGIAQIIERFTVAKSTILDPFVGGGSTAIAALALDRIFIGIDIEKSAISKTAKRIEETKLR